MDPIVTARGAGATGVPQRVFLSHTSDLGPPAETGSFVVERALAIRERVLGPDHPDTATTRGHLADLEG
jgi:hypothetical protein